MQYQIIPNNGHRFDPQQYPVCVVRWVLGDSGGHDRAIFLGYFESQAEAQSFVDKYTVAVKA